MFSMRFVFTLFAIFSLPNIAYAERPSFGFLNWSMALPEMISAAQGAGYSCQKYTLESGASGATCDKGTGKGYKAIYIREKDIIFNCTVYNGCEVPIDVMVIRLMSDGSLLVSTIEYKTRKDITYCGGGYKGDTICIALTGKHRFPVIRDYFRNADISHVILTRGD